jgi:N-acetylneuraminic acid mutarotase
MSVARSLHKGITLNDGRVLVCGGAGILGAVTATCEIFDPTTNTWSQTGSMNSPRAGHGATLLSDGRVLVTGGVSSILINQLSLTPLGDILNQAVNTGEVFNPFTNSWALVANTMATKRVAHSQTLMQDGRVISISGLNGANLLLGIELPIWTATSSIYDPATNAFVAGPNIALARFGHQATRMPNGEIFVSGGLSPVSVLGTVTGVNTTNSCVKLNVAGTTWSSAGTLPAGAMSHAQTLLKNGRVHISGGFVAVLLATTLTTTARDECGVRASGATAVTQTQDLINPRGSHSTTRMYDGSLLLVGGTDGIITLASTYQYTPGH